MNCKDCKHWDYDKDFYGNIRKDIGVCRRVKMFWDCSMWNEEGTRIFTDDSLAFVQDGSDYHAELLSRPEFGCVMWEAQ